MEPLPEQMHQQMIQEEKLNQLKNNPDILTKEIRMPSHPIPAKKTSYYCVNANVPVDTHSHIVRIEPIREHIKVIHHMVLFICDSKPSNEVNFFSLQFSS